MTPEHTSDYPQPLVTPELFETDKACNTALPVGEVIEWFDFGQFVELYATDASGGSHPLVLTQDDAVAQATLHARENGATPTRAVDLSGGVPLNRVVTGDDFDPFKTLPPPEPIDIDDVDDLVARGTRTIGNTTYAFTLPKAKIDKLRDSEPVILRARASSGTTKWRTWLQLKPKVIDVPVTDLDAILASRALIAKVDDTNQTIELKLEPLEIAALLAGRTVVVRGTIGEQTRLVRLQQREGVKAGFAASPAVTEVVIEDLATFLAKPIVQGTDNLPFEVPLTTDVVKALRSTGSAQISAGGKVLTLRLKGGRA
jgi:hypothetical protein